MKNLIRKKIVTVLVVFFISNLFAQDIIELYAGDGTSAYGGDGSAALAAQIKLPRSLSDLNSRKKV